MIEPAYSRSRGTGQPAISAVSKWLLGLKTSPPRLNLALQGGGAHGAFTWGVLDALLADPRIEFEGLSGSSAGAMNAVIFASGWMNGGRDGARQALLDFWTEVGKQMPRGMMTQGQGDTFSQKWSRKFEQFFKWKLWA